MDEKLEKNFLFSKDSCQKIYQHVYSSPPRTDHETFLIRKVHIQRQINNFSIINTLKRKDAQ